MMLRGVTGSTISFEEICFGSTPNEAVIGIVAEQADATDFINMSIIIGI